MMHQGGWVKAKASCELSGGSGGGMGRPPLGLDEDRRFLGMRIG